MTPIIEKINKLLSLAKSSNANEAAAAAAAADKLIAQHRISEAELQAATKVDLPSAIKDANPLYETARVTAWKTHLAHFLAAKYESDRANLKEGEECFLCGSKEHPFVNHKININADETTSIIAQKKQIFDEENKALRIIELNLSKLETKIESSILELKKLSKNKEEIEQVFSLLNFILTDDSKINLEEEKQLLEEELKNIIKTRDEKEKVLAQRDNLQKELNTNQ